MTRFENKQLLIVTKHGKEKVLKPILQNGLLVQCVVSNDIDTDLFGTFAGEKERKLTAIETLKAKCAEGLKKDSFDFVLASEGSFGSHPFIPFAQADEEIILLYDVKRKTYYQSRVLSTKTNLSSKTVATIHELRSFAEKIGFPEHGIILKDTEKDFQEVIKDANDWEKLEQAFDKLIRNKTNVFVETDLRAMRNPNRLNVIAQAAQKLVELLLNTCPSCEAPGFEVQKYESGLPCEQCGLPTKSIKSHSFICRECQHIETVAYPNGKKTESPQFCDFCNP